MKNSFLLLIFMICAGVTFSQSAKYGKVSLADLQKKKSEIDSTAPAEILEKNVYIYIDKEFRLLTEVFVRIKIYDKLKAERHLAFQNIFSNSEDISFKAITFNIENGKVIETNLERSQQFTKEYNKYNKVMKAAFPNVKDGSVIDYKLSIAAPKNLDCRVQNFQFDIPLQLGRYYIEYPEIIYYNLDVKGFTPPKSHNKGSIRWNDKYYAHTFEITYENVKGLPEEKYVINRNNAISSVKLNLTGVAIPGEVYKNVAGSWDHVVQFLMKYEDFGLQFLDSKKLREEVAQVVGNEKDTMQIVKKLFTHVQQHYNWNESESLVADKGVDKCFETKTGNSAELNLLLWSMLKAANISAYPFVLSTIDHGIVNPTISSLYALDYVITAVRTQKGYQLMDASHKYSQINLLPEKCLNYWGFAIDKDKAIQVEIKNKTESRYFYSIDAKFDNQLQLSGKANCNLGSSTAMDILLEKKDKTDLVKQMIHLVKNYKDSISVNEKNGNLDIKYVFKPDGLVDLLDDKIIFNPLLFLPENSNPFESANREFPIEFGSPSSTTKKVRIEIPTGYKIGDLPKSKKILFENIGEFKYAFQVSEDSIVEVVSSFKVLRDSYYIEENTALKELWQHKIDGESQLLSFVKK